MFGHVSYSVTLHHFSKMISQVSFHVKEYQKVLKWFSVYKFENVESVLTVSLVLNLIICQKGTNIVKITIVKTIFYSFC